MDPAVCYELLCEIGMRYELSFPIDLKSLIPKHDWKQVLINIYYVEDTRNVTTFNSNVITWIPVLYVFDWDVLMSLLYHNREGILPQPT